MFKKLFQLKELLLSILFIFAILVSTTALAETNSSQSIENSVVSLQVGKRGGTAFYIGEGQFVTNFHIVHGLMFLSKNEINFAENVYVRYDDDKKIPIKEILHLDALNDLAVLKVSSKYISLLEERMKPLEILSSIVLQSDSKYEAIVMDYTAKIPQRIQLPINSKSLVLKDGNLRFPENIKPGMSGSPILLDNKVIGIIKSKLESNNFATPSTDLFRLLKEKPLFCKNTSCIKAELESLKIKAQNGDVKVQYRLGSLYFKKGITTESKKWLLKAAAQGDAKAQFNLGILYYDEGNLVEAIKWYKKAAEQGDANTQVNLGVLYENEGRIAEAKKWYLKAAAQEHVSAQFNLGVLYEDKGRIAEAKKWYLKAAAQEHINAQNNLGVIYYHEGNLAEARKWFLKAAQKGRVKAQFNLGVLYENEGRIAESKKWYLKAAAQEHINAQNNLGVIYYNEGNLAEAIKWYSKAAAQGHANAQVNLELIYEDEGRIEEAKKSILKKSAKKSIKIIKNSSICKKSFTK